MALIIAIIGIIILASMFSSERTSNADFEKQKKDWLAERERCEAVLTDREMEKELEETWNSEENLAEVERVLSRFVWFSGKKLWSEKRGDHTNRILVMTILMAEKGKLPHSWTYAGLEVWPITFCVGDKRWAQGDNLSFYSLTSVQKIELGRLVKNMLRDAGVDVPIYWEESELTKQVRVGVVPRSDDPSRHII